MRLLLPALACAYVAGIALADAGVASVGGAAWLALQSAGLGIAASGARARALAAVGVALGAGALALARPLESAAAATPCAVREVIADARVDEVRATALGSEVVLAGARPVPANEAPLPARILLHAEASPGAVPWRAGARVRVALRLAPPPGRTNPGGMDRRHALARRGIAAVAREVHPRLRYEHAPGATLALAPWRRRGAERLLREGEGGAFLAALGLGEAAVLAPATRSALARLGLSHLVAVSGLHLVLVAAPAYAFAAGALRRSAFLAARGDTRRPALGLAVVCAAFYAAFTGLAPPVQRALVFLVLLALAQRARRPLAPEGLLAAAALAVAASEPAAVFAPGVQLSFAATAALLFAAPARAPSAAGPARGLGALGAGLVAALRTSASATAATGALVAWHFGSVSPLGWLANGVAVPLTSFVYLPLALAAGVAAVAAPELETGALAHAIAAAAHFAAASLDAVEVAALWVPAWAAVAPGALGLAASALLALACVRARRTGLRLALGCLAAGAPLLGRPPAVEPAPPRVVFFDVGQGDAALVEGRTARVLVDGGVAAPGRFDAGQRVVLPALAALGVRSLDLVAASHADADHAGGLVAVVRELPVARLWLPPGGRREPAFAALVAAARRRGVVIEERAAGDSPLPIGDLELTPLWPPRERGPHGRNDASLVLRVELAGRVLLLPGDVESAGEHALVAESSALRADILKLAHHGSRTSSSARFLDAVAPAFAVVSAPLRGRFGMPHPEVVARLSERGLAFGWTGRDGALLVGLRPRLDVHAFAAGEPRGQAAHGSAACSSLIPNSSSKPAGWTGDLSLPPMAPRSR